MIIEDNRTERQVLADCMKIKRKIARETRGMTFEQRKAWSLAKLRRIEAEHGIKINFSEEKPLTPKW